MTIQQLTQFFGWCTLLSFSLLIVTTIVLVAARGPMTKIHARLFGLEEAALTRIYVQYVSFFKILVIVFNLVPYIALKIMA